MKALKVAAVVVLALLLAVAGFATYLVRSLDTPEFKKSVLERVREAAGLDVQVQDMSLSVLSGMTLRGVTVANPPGYKGPLLTADSFSLRYKLLPLLRGQLEVETLSLEKPVLTLAPNAKGAWNYERIGAAAAAEKKAKAPSKKGKPAAESAPGPAIGSPLELVLSRIALDDAEIVMLGEKDAPLVRIQDADLASSLKLAGTVAEGKGKASVGTINLADALFVRNLSAPIEVGRGKLQLDPVRASLAGGTVSGILTVGLKGGLRYAVNLEVKGAQVKKLLEEAGSARAVSGTLEGKAWFEGSGGLPTMTGTGRAEIQDCKVAGAPVLVMLADLLGLPELKNPDFDECKTEFSLGSSRLQMPVLKLLGPDIQLDGKGVTSLVDYSLSYDMTLALRKASLERIPVREMRAAFQDRPDGFSALDFKVSGTTDAPQTDLTARLGKAAAGELVKGGLGKLFGKKK